MIRLFIPDSLVVGARVSLAAEQAHYLTGVMRRAIGDEVLLFNGRDGEWRSALTAVAKRGCELEARALTRPQTWAPDLDLVVALVKRARLETIVEKAAELGARRVLLTTTRFTNADHTNVARLRAIAVEASEQTGRLDAPEILAPVKLDRLLHDWSAARRLVFCDEAGDARPMMEALAHCQAPSPLAGEGGPRSGSDEESQALSDQSISKSQFVRIGKRDPSSGPSGHLLPQGEKGKSGDNSIPVFPKDGGGGPAAILIGPEGGFSPEERAHLRTLPFVTPVSLGPRILRADTAAISALSLWQAAVGDWR